MRRASRLLAIIGVVLLVLAGVWKLVAPGQLGKYPLDVDKTFTEAGDVTLASNPTNLAPQAYPPFNLNVKVQLHVVDHFADNVVVDEVQTQKIGPLKPEVRTLRYVFDRRSIKNVESPRAWAFMPSTVVNRSPNFAVNFPIHSGNGPYPVWKDETGTAFGMSKVGSTAVNGTKLSIMRGTITNVPVQTYFLDTLRQFAPKSESLTALAPALKAQGIDPTTIEQAVAPRLSATDRAAVLEILAKPVNLVYLASGTTTMWVEPVTGIITSINVDETITWQPDIAQIGRVQLILARPTYATDPAVTLASGLLRKAVASPPTATLVRIRYGSTKPSITDVTAFSKTIKNKVALIETIVPVTLLVAGLVLLLLGFAAGRLARRRRVGGPVPAEVVYSRVNSP